MRHEPFLLRFFHRECVLVFATIIGLTFSLLITRPAHATITITGVERASGFENTTTPVVIFGGNAGYTTGGTEVEMVNTCLTAAPGEMRACNEASIHAGLNLTIFFKSDSKDGYPIIYRVDTGGTILPINQVVPQVLITKGNIGTITVLWGDVCRYMSGTSSGSTIDASCLVTGTGAVTQAFKIGITDQPGTNVTTDTGDVQITVSSYAGQTAAGGPSTTKRCDDTTSIGVCHFEVGAGDAKVAVKSIQGISPFPNGPTLKFTKLRLLWQEASSAQDPSDPAFLQISASADTSHKRDLSISSASTPGSITVTPQRVDGLQNDVAYAFKVALVDQAGNIGYYTDDSANNYCDFTSNPASQICHLAMPGEVVGVLSEDVNCFVATAAFGSKMAKQVRMLREFRNRILLPTKWGAAFVKFYYQHGPKYARMIAQHETLRAVARGFLWPLLAFAWLSLKIGAVNALCALLVALALGATILRSRASKRRPSA